MGNVGTALMKELQRMKTEEYNKEPVVYCKHCLSLKILKLDSEIDYCDDCGNTTLAVTDIDTWERMYEEKYGKKYINKN